MGIETFATVRKEIEYLETHCGFKSFLRGTVNMHDEYGIISGNIRAWRDFISANVEWVGVIPAYMYSVINDYPRLFPEYAPGIDKDVANLFRYFTPITVADLQTDTEHLVHHDITMNFVCDRGVTHEIVRHRPASYAQESTRYCNYSGDKFGNEITVVLPSWCDVGSLAYEEWKAACENAETRYIWMTQNMECSPQEARSVLPTSTKAELVMTASVGEFRHFFKLRTDSAAHPDIRAVAIPALASIKTYPVTGLFFRDI
jgi:thymidylate synthase (FAD)